ncbi:MAG: DUF2182 domain-containing protein [Acetobacteraceae bacterium]
MGALRMGLLHGVYCLSCCWLLFAILFPLGIMNIAAMAAITLVGFAEKTLPWGRTLPRRGICPWRCLATERTWGRPMIELVMTLDDHKPKRIGKAGRMKLPDLDHSEFIPFPEGQLPPPDPMA